jgi:hypothetical protein
MLFSVFIRPTLNRLDQQNIGIAGWSPHIETGYLLRGFVFFIVHRPAKIMSNTIKRCAAKSLSCGAVLAASAPQSSAGLRAEALQWRSLMSVRPTRRNKSSMPSKSRRSALTLTADSSDADAVKQAIDQPPQLRFGMGDPRYRRSAMHRRMYLAAIGRMSAVRTRPAAPQKAAA